MSDATHGSNGKSGSSQTVCLVLVEADGDAVCEATRQALTVARELAGTVEAVVLAADEEPARRLAPALAADGVARVHAVTDPLLAEYGPEAFGAALAQLIRSVEPTGVVAPGTARGNEIMAHTAAVTDLSLATGCVAIAVDGDAWSVTRQRWGGVLWEDAALAASVKLATLAPHAVAVQPTPGREHATVSIFACDLDPTLARTRVAQRTPLGAGVTLSTAPVVVSGGRGVGSAEGFAVLEELADRLGGAVGCSRVATNNGWRPHADQVGQTGTRIAPNLYIACGISGATQHWVGCKDAQRILAINTDPEASLVQRADYAIIGDVQTVLRAVVDELDRARQPADAGAGG
jgi:electron transfer flavoprotein alpha subunit